MHLGFRQEGLLRSHVVDPISEQPLDLFINGCLSHEFFNNQKLMVLANRLLGRTPHDPSEGQMQLPGAAKPEELMLQIANALTDQTT